MSRSARLGVGSWVHAGDPIPALSTQAADRSRSCPRIQTKSSTQRMVEPLLYSQQQKTSTNQDILQYRISSTMLPIFIE
jgi:hypothetical protein